MNSEEPAALEPSQEARIETWLRALTLEEKVSLVSGSGLWHTTPVSRLGIPALKVTDGPNGARGNAESGATAACFPAGCALGATWDEDLVRKIGAALGDETRSKGAQVVLGPTINLHRTPLGGRNFESYSEDPFLTGKIATAFVRGVQSRGVGACLKHFVCNDSEFERHTISSEVGERALGKVHSHYRYAMLQQVERESTEARSQFEHPMLSPDREFLREVSCQLARVEIGFARLEVCVLTRRVERALSLDLVIFLQLFAHSLIFNSSSAWDGDRQSSTSSEISVRRS